jgi:LysR family transcriptional regulator, hypochlorite-specific transcription factor HypT
VTGGAVGGEVITRWFDDLLALAEAGTLTKAAALRNLTQPAFTRRIQQIERTLGVTLLDRSHRPAQLTPAVLAKLNEIRAISGELRELTNDLRGAGVAQGRVVIATQHTLSLGMLPAFLEEVTRRHRDLSIRLRSANRNDCYGLLMTRQASVMIAYETRTLRVAQQDSMLETAFLASDELIPVATRHLASTLKAAASKSREIPVVSFPRGRFFGDLLAQQILPSAQLQGRRLRVVCETSFIPAALAMAAAGAGVAWLPRSLCKPYVEAGALEQLNRTMGHCALDIVCARRSQPKPTAGAALFWDRLLEFMTCSA